MKPKAAETWNMALGSLRNAEQHFNEGKGELIKDEAFNAVVYGRLAIYCLLGEGGENDISVDAMFDFMDDNKTKHYSPKELIKKMRKVLNCFSDLTPPENKLPRV